MCVVFTARFHCSLLQVLVQLLICVKSVVLTGQTGAGVCLKGRLWQSDKIVYVHNPLSCSPSVVVCYSGFSRWGNLKLRLLWLSGRSWPFGSPLTVLCLSSEGRVALCSCSWERLQSSASITAVIQRAFVLTWLSFITELGSAHFNGPSVECTVEGSEPDGQKQPFFYV